MPFRLEPITLADRVELGCTCLLFAGQYGVVTALATEWGTSRQFLYDLRATAATALELALAPGTPGRPPLDRRLVVDRALVARTIVVLNQVPQASVRAIQDCLTEILAVPRSVGAIHAVLVDAAQRARALPLVPAGPVSAQADELFAAQQPILGVVEPQSGAVLALEPAPSRDETAWGCTWLDLAARGVVVTRLTTDGAESLRAGVRAAGLPAPRLDHWHTLRELGRIRRSLEAEAYRRLDAAERSQRAAAAEAYRQEHGRRPRRGRPLRVASDPASVARARQEADAAIRRAEGAAILLSAVQEALRPLEPQTGRVHSAAGTRAELAAAAQLLRELGGRAVDAAEILEQRATGLVGYLVDLETALQAPRAGLEEEAVTFLAWAWQHRAALGLTAVSDAWPEAPPAAGQVWTALDGAVRATGMAENLNSVLAPHRASRDGSPASLLAVLAVYRNHRVFPRGKRAGHSPAELLGIPAPHWLDALGYGRTSAPARREFPVQPEQTVNTLAA